MTDSLHSLIKNIAANHVLTCAVPIGERVYSWEDWADPMDDTTAECYSDYSPSEDADYYSWTEVKSCEILETHIESCDEVENKFEVQVTAKILAMEGDSESEEEKLCEPEEIIFYLDIVWDTKDIAFIVEDCQT